MIRGRSLAGSLAGTAALAVFLAGGAIVAHTASARSAPAVPAEAVTGTPRTPAGADFTAAAAEFGVPEALLLAYSFVLTGWQDHGGLPRRPGWVWSDAPHLA